MLASEAKWLSLQDKTVLSQDILDKILSASTYDQLLNQLNTNLNTAFNQQLAALKAQLKVDDWLKLITSARETVVNE